MTTTLADPPAIDTTAPRRAAVALARVEAVRLLRHPLTIVATLFLLGIWVSAWFTNEVNHYPVLQDVDRDSDLGMMLLLGAAALIAGNLAVLRAHRDGTTKLGQVLILPDPQRTLAHLLAVVPVAVLGAVLILARIAVLAIFTPAAGHPNPYELAIGPVTVLVLGALGVLLGRLTRSAIVAPLVLLVLLASLVVLPLLAQGGSAQWLQPVVAQGDPALPAPAPAALMARPAAAHVAYLLGLAGLLAVAAVWRAGAGTRRVAVAGSLAVVLTVAGGVLQAQPPSRATVAARTAAMNHPSQHQTCRPLGGVSYCAFDGFTGWIPAWNTVVQGVLARVPVSARPSALTVRQRFVVLGPNDSVNLGSVVAAWRADDRAAGTPNAVTATTRWGDSRSAVSLGALVAYQIVTGGNGSDPCGGAGVLVGWLAGQVSTQTRTGLRLLAQQAHGDGDQNVVSFGDVGVPDLGVPKAEIDVAMAALARPTAEIAARVQASWATLIAPGTTAAQAAQILGVPAPSTSPACR
jgi:hypothetical protein